MSATLAAVRDALQARLGTISGLRVHDTWPDTVNPPFAIIRPLSADPHLVIGAAASGIYVLEVTVGVQLSTYRMAQDALDPYLATSGTQSITATIEADPRLGGVVDYAIPSVWRDYGGIQINSASSSANPTEYLGAVLDVTVYV